MGGGDVAPRTLGRVRVACSRYNVCLSGGSDISIDDLKKSPHSDSRSQNYKVGELVLTCDIPRTQLSADRKTWDWKREGLDARMHFGVSCIRERKEETFGTDLRVVHQIFFVCATRIRGEYA